MLVTKTNKNKYRDLEHIDISAVSSHIKLLTVLHIFHINLIIQVFLPCRKQSYKAIIDSYIILLFPQTFFLDFYKRDSLGLRRPS